MLRTILAFALVAATLFPAQAGLLELSLQKKTFPGCHDTKVLGDIVERFNWAEEKTWHRGLYLADILRPRESSLQEEGRLLIPRRYCRAEAQLSNGHHRKLFYMIAGGQGFAGNSFNVEFCVQGLDPWRVHDGSCRAIRY